MRVVCCLALLAALGGPAPAQLPIDSQLAAVVAKIKAIDNHAHPMRPTLGSDKNVDDDALPVETMEASTEPVRTRHGSPLALEASHALFGNAKDFRERKRQVLAEKGASYANWVLDQLGIETMLANRIAMGPGLAPPRFPFLVMNVYGAVIS
jgi:hypothetical protein